VSDPVLARMHRLRAVDDRQDEEQAEGGKQQVAKPRAWSHGVIVALRG
jgi:hypothetical protein